MGKLGKRENVGGSDATMNDGATMKRTQTLIQLLDTKTISMFGGITLLFNNMTGPAVPQTPNIFQQSGWVAVVISLAIFATISALCSLFIVEAMQGIPGNKHFQGTVEFGTLIHFYFGKSAHILGQICLYGALESNAIASMIQASQTFDNIIMDIFGKACGVSLSPNFGYLCISERTESLSVFGDRIMLFTFGYLVMVCFVITLSRCTLSESVWMQVGSFVLTFVIFFLWVVLSFIHGVNLDYVPAVGDSSGFGGLFGVIMLNFSFCAGVPSWINIKKNDVNVQGTLWLSTLTGFLTYVVVGVIPALSYLVPNSSNLIAVMGSATVVGRIAGHFFSLIILLPNIPVFMVIEHANLEQNFKFNKYVSLFLCYILPVLLVIPLLTGPGLTTLIVWSSLIFVSTANFIVPLLIYLQAVKFRKKYNETRELTEEQKKLLKKIHWQSRTINQFIDQYAFIKGKILETRASSMILSGGGHHGLAGRSLGDIPSRAISMTGAGPLGVLHHSSTKNLSTRLTQKLHIGRSDPNLSAVASFNSLHGGRIASSGLLVPRISQSGAAYDGLGGMEPRESLSQAGRVAIGSSGTIASESGNVPFAEREGWVSGSPPNPNNGFASMVASNASMYKKKVSLIVLDEDGLPAITVDPPSLTSHFEERRVDTREEPCLKVFASLKSMGSLPNSGRNSVAAAIGGETKSLSSCRNSLASKIQESIISIKDIKAITFEKRSRQSSVASKDVPKLAINGEEASVDEDPFFMIEAFLLEDVPDPDMEDMEEDEYLASLNDEESPGSPNEEPHASATPIRGRLQSLAALFKSKESLNDSRSNLSRTGSSIFGIGSIKSLANSVIGGIGATSTSSPKKKRPPRARMGSARSNFSLRSDSSNRNHGDKSEGGNRDSVHARERVVSIDSISIVEEEGDVALSPSFDGASPIAGARKASFEVSVHKQEDKTFIQDGSGPHVDGSQMHVPALVVNVAEESPRDEGKELGTGGLFVTPRTDIPTKNIFNRSGSNSSASNLTPISSSCQIHFPAKVGSILSINSGLRDNNSAKFNASQVQIYHKALGSPIKESSIIPSHSGGEAGHAHPPLMRRRSLPTHPDFISKAFRSIPRWVPFRAKSVAMFCIVVTTLATFSNLVYNLITIAAVSRG